MKRIRRRYCVPANVFRQSIEGRIRVLRLELGCQELEVELRRKELEEKALPALRARHGELVAEWEQLPDDDLRHTRRPYLMDLGSESAIITYRRTTLWLKIQEKWHWGSHYRDRWYEDAWIRVESVYQFEHTREGWNGTLESRIRELQRLLKEYEGEGWVLMTESNLGDWGLSPEEFHWVIE